MDDDELDSPPANTFDMQDPEQRRLAIFHLCFSGAAYVDPLVDHIWARLADPKELWVALIMQRAGLSGSDKPALKALLQKIVAEWTKIDNDLGVLPMLNAYPSFEAWNEASLAYMASGEAECWKVACHYADNVLAG